MTILNISVPESMEAFINEQIVQGGYNDANEYILHLLRQEQEQSQAAQVEALLLEGLESGKPIEVTEDWWERKRTTLMQQLP
jgi:antitoxin ParD1/3/4